MVQIHFSILRTQISSGHDCTLDRRKRSGDWRRRRKNEEEGRGRRGGGRKRRRGRRREQEEKGEEEDKERGGGGGKRKGAEEGVRRGVKGVVHVGLECKGSVTAGKTGTAEES